jgi:hypothetical protein
MLQFVCDSCLAVKQPADVWILGMAAESVGVTAARREITILAAWDRERAVHPLAVHFCSEVCKDRYVSALFAGDTPTKDVVLERVPTTARNARHKVARRKSVATTNRKSGSAAKSRSPRKKRAA